MNKYHRVFLFRMEAVQPEIHSRELQDSTNQPEESKQKMHDS